MTSRTAGTPSVAARRVACPSPARSATAAGRVTLATLMLVALSGAALFVGVRVAPALHEYLLVDALVGRIAAASPATVAQARDAFDRQRRLDGIVALQGRDLEVMFDGPATEIAFAYRKEVSLAGPVALVIEFRGQARGEGRAP